MISELLSLDSVIETLVKEPRPIFLYGMGNGGEKIYKYLTDNGIKIKGFVASEGFLRGQDFLGYPVKSIADAENQYGELCLVLCFGLEGEKSRFLSDLSKKHRILSPNLPVFGEGAFDKKYISENIEKIERVYSYLADEASREIFISLIKYNITGEIEYLSDNNGLIPPDGFYSHNKRHIDIGAYDGDTANEFITYNTEYSDIVALEPDENTYKKLVKNTSHIRDILPLNAAAGLRDGVIAVDSNRGRATSCGSGDNTITMRSVDSICGFSHINAEGIPTGSIKIDAEGMDEEVICGAVNTIYCEKPALCVALYHRAYDLIELPLLIRKHNPKYKFYLRKKEYIPAWDIFIYCKE